MSATNDPACLFCRIVSGDIPSTKVAEDEAVLAIRDIAPQAPIHVLVMPKRHVARTADLGEADGELLGAVFAMLASVARDEGLEERGYRIVANTGEWGGQSVDHVHFHLLGGRPMTWPPG